MHRITTLILLISFLLLNYNQPIPLVKYNGPIEHIFSHCLLAYPEIAFSEKNNMKNHYANDCITKNEFNNILEELYKNNYILININNIFYLDKNGNARKKDLFLPKNKKPLIMSFDDVNYDHRKSGKGMVDKLILKNNIIATSTIIDGENFISTSNEFVCILENFIKKHNDFSFQGARATINLTGYDGILGYRTQKSNLTNRDEEIKKAKSVVKILKGKGYNFASHSYGHYHMKKITDEDFKAELIQWKNEVEPIVGNTQIYVYPYGEWEITNDNKICNKHNMLKDFGFKLFCGVGTNAFYGYLPWTSDITEKVLFMDRVPIDGYTITNNKQKISRLFDANKIIDKIRKNSS